MDKPIRVYKHYATVVLPPPLPDPTEEELARWAARDKAKQDHLKRGLDSAPEVLTPIIELHFGFNGGECEGCDGGGDYGTEWPCRTIELIADTYDPEN